MDIVLNVNDLIDIMNHYITLHKIKIETTDNSGTTLATRL